MHLHPTCPADIPALQEMLGTIDLFPPDMLPELLEMSQDAIWLTALVGDIPRGLAFAVPEDLTEGTWNMRALGIHVEYQRCGLARALCTALEDHLRAASARLLIVDTSSTAPFAGARAFYDAAGYENVARIAEFWAPGDDKVIFRKAL